MRIGSLFSGAGGLDLAALELFDGAGMAWHSEVDPAASKVLAHHWPDIPNLGDVTQIDWKGVEPIDILTGGYPCQPFSAAGKRKGPDDERHLWPYVREAIRHLRPRFTLLENVAGHRSLGFDRVLADMAADGLDAEWCSIRASAVGAAHRRERLFILAYPANSKGGGREGIDDRTGGAASCGGRERVARGGAGFGVTADSDSRSVREQPESESRCKGATVTRRDRESVADTDRSGSQGAEPTPGFDMSAGSGGGPVALLPTPQVADATGGHKHRSGARSNELLLPGVVEAYAKGSLFPTPRASDGTKGGPNQRGSSGDLMLPSAVVQLLPTPRASDGSGGPNPLARAERMDDVETRVIRLGDQWGDYAPAIARQEALSRPAPAATELSVKGNPRLSPAFAEWLMFWPKGWVTDPAIGLSRNDQLHIVGNGVVPPQAVAAFRHLLARIPMEAAS